MKIVHLIRADKFMQWAIEIFNETFPNSNEYYILTNIPDNKLKFLENISYQNVEPKALVKSLSQKKDVHIILHSLNESNFEFLKNYSIKKNNNNKIYWIGWGGDYYNLENVEHKYFLSETHKLYIKSISLKNYLKRKILRTIFQISFKTNLKKINYFAPVLPNEFDIFFNNSNSCNLHLKEWNYGYIGKHHKYPDGNLDPKYVLFGNSGSFSNNHIDVLKKYKNVLENKIIVFPLSYGGNSKYRNYVKQYIKNNFDENKFIILEKMMPNEEYNKLLLGCAWGVMGHKRQQGVGNIYALMHQGSLLFLDKNNATFQYLKSKGAIIETLENLSKEPNLLNYVLTNEEKKINKNIIVDILSQDSIIEKTKAFIEV